MPRSHKEVEDLLQSLERVLQHSNHWSSALPPKEALLSQLPFACDVLTFEQWLQFILIPKLRLLIKNNQVLPGKMQLLPMGELSFTQVTSRDLILPVLAKLDQFFEE